MTRHGRQAGRQLQNRTIVDSLPRWRSVGWEQLYWLWIVLPDPETGESSSVPRVPSCCHVPRLAPDSRTATAGRRLCLARPVISEAPALYVKEVSNRERFRCDMLRERLAYREHLRMSAIRSQCVPILVRGLSIHHDRRTIRSIIAILVVQCYIQFSPVSMSPIAGQFN